MSESAASENKPKRRAPVRRGGAAILEKSDSKNQDQIDLARTTGEKEYERRIKSIVSTMHEHAKLEIIGTYLSEISEEERFWKEGRR